MITVVIPAYNEQKTIKKVVTETLKHYGDVIVVNDASTDKTGEILCDLPVTQIINEVNSGHAKSLLTGLKAATGEYILYMDADGQISPSELDVDFVSGYRTHRHDKFFRKVVSFILKAVIFLRHGYVIKDANCPFKVIKRAQLRRLLRQLPKNSVVPTICLSILARRNHLRVIEIPVEHTEYKNRKGSLQSINKKSLTMFWKALLEVVWL